MDNKNFKENINQMLGSVIDKSYDNGFKYGICYLLKMIESSLKETGDVVKLRRILDAMEEDSQLKGIKDIYLMLEKDGK